MTDEKTTQNVHLKDMPIPLKYEATGEYRQVKPGEYYVDGFGYVSRWERRVELGVPSKGTYIILRERKPQPGPWEEDLEFVGVRPAKDIPDEWFAWNLLVGLDMGPEDTPCRVAGRHGEDPCFCFRPKAKPSLAERLRSLDDDITDLPQCDYNRIACKLYPIADDIEAREKAIAEVIAELREIGCHDGRLHDCADKLEGKE